MTTTRESTLENSQTGVLRTLQLSGHGVSIRVLPELGGKISSITWENQDLLFQNPDRPLRAARDGASYAEFDASGFDECIPSTGACDYPVEPWSGIPVPDHGELWSIGWSAHLESDAIHLSVDSVQFPYSLSKTVELLPTPGVRIQYVIKNRSQSPFPFLWSAHPLLATEPGTRIHLPAPLTVTADCSRDERLGEQFSTISWPATIDRGGNTVDLSLIGEPELGYVEKLYTSRLTEGWCGVHHPSSGRWLGMVFSTETTLFVGLSINQGGWPVEGRSYFNLGLEPCNGFPDRLNLAVARGSYGVVQPNETLDWQLSLYIGTDSDFPFDRMQVLSRQS